MELTIKELRQVVRESLEEGFKDSAKKFIKMLPLFTISLGAVACGQGSADHADKFRTDGFTEDEITVIEDAVAEVCEKTEGRKCVTFGEEGDSSLGVAEKVECPNSGPHGPDTRISGCNTHSPDTNVSNIVVRANRSDPEWLQKLHDTVQHEVLHHFHGNKTHLPTGNRLAANKVDQGVYVTDLDVKGL
jgi:hypothetical protein